MIITIAVIIVVIENNINNIKNGYVKNGDGTLSLLSTRYEYYVPAAFKHRVVESRNVERGDDHQAAVADEVGKPLSPMNQHL